MRRSIVIMATLFIASSTHACPPSPPVLMSSQTVADNPDFAQDAQEAEEARQKLWTNCHEKAANDCEMQCDATSLAKFHYAEGDVHYQYSAEERKAASERMDSLKKKWNQ